MRFSLRSFMVALVLAGVGVGSWWAVSTAAQQPARSGLAGLVLPPGFRIEVFAENVEGARQMALGPKGTVFVGTRGQGKVYAVVDRNGDHKADEVRIIAENLPQPNGVAFKDGSLYVATQRQILRFDGIEDKLAAVPPSVVVHDALPFENNSHSWKYLKFGPDGLLYVPVGAPCNICEPPAGFATILRMKPDGSSREIFAEGVRNTVGFDWHPQTRDLWFTDNGRDNLGDEVPNDELNVAFRQGLHFGYPYCHQGDTPDPEFKARPCSAFEPPAQKVGPHAGTLGVLFYTGTMFPAAYRNAAFLVQHGSWNRTVPLGYRVMVARMEGRKVTSFEPFIDGFLPGIRYNQPDGRTGNQPAYGRPVDAITMPDGSLLLSDDTGHRLYRVTYAR